MVDCATACPDATSSNATGRTAITDLRMVSPFQVN
jgi:hypothetical protein